MFEFYDNIKRNKRNTVIIMILFSVAISLIAWAMLEVLGIRSWWAIFIIPGSIITTLTTYWNSSKIILASVNAKEATGKYEVIENILDELMIASGLEVRPKIYIIESDQLNAFATGRDRENSIICVTTGLIEKLTRGELEGVIAHELTHIINYDIRLSAVVSCMVGIVTLLANMAIHSSVDVEDAPWYVAFLGFGAVILFSILGPILAQIVAMCISRKREFLADAGAVALTRNPQGLIDALLKISEDTEELGKEIDTKVTAQMFIEDPNLQERKKKKINLFATHPSIEDRIKAIKELI